MCSGQRLHVSNALWGFLVRIRKQLLNKANKQHNQTYNGPVGRPPRSRAKKIRLGRWLCKNRVRHKLSAHSARSAISRTNKHWTQRESARFRGPQKCPTNGRLANRGATFRELFDGRRRAITHFDRCFSLPGPSEKWSVNSFAVTFGEKVKDGSFKRSGRQCSASRPVHCRGTFRHFLDAG